MSSFDYQLSTITKYRAGTSTDPYIDITETKQVVNGQIQLNEIPVPLYKVRIPNMFEVPHTNTNVLKENEYRVDYTEGIIYFHLVAENTQKTYTYKGRGNHFVSYHRIWTKEDNGEVLETLGDIIDAGTNAIEQVKHLDELIKETEDSIELVHEATINANNKADYAKTQGDYAKTQGDYAKTQADTASGVITSANGKIDEMDNTIAAANSKIAETETARQDAITATGNANTSADYAKAQGDYAKDQGDYAKAQGNYAKDQGDYATQRGDDLVLLGEYSPTVPYKTNNMVTYNNKLYMAIKDSTGVEPGEVDTEYWRIIVQTAVSTEWDSILNKPSLVETSREINTGAGLIGGGDLSSDRTLTVDFEENNGVSTQASRSDHTHQNLNQLIDDLSNEKRSAVTLQPGISVVSAEQDAAFRLAGLQGRTALNYQGQIGIFGVRNPYAIRYGENLLPTFMDWKNNLGTTKVINSPYDITINNPNNGDDIQYYFDCSEGDVFTLSVEHTGRIGVNAWDINGNTIGTNSLVPYTANQSVTFTMPIGTARASIHFGNVASEGQFIATCSFKNPMLNLGTTAKPFTPREDAMLAMQTELHANPDTGANPDMVFERDGQYFKLAKWHKEEVSQKYTFSSLAGSASGWKQVYVSDWNRPIPTANAAFLTKFNGVVLVRKEGEKTSADQFGIHNTAGYLYITIANTDSGWGDAYTPTDDEIKAYFMGWKMFNAEVYFGTEPDATYNGTGTKRWCKQLFKNQASFTLPTTSYSEWTPYQLLYQLATHTVEPITSEGQLTFFEGDNQVEVGTGIVLREHAPILRTATAAAMGDASAPTKYKISKVLQSFKNNKHDPAWLVSTVNAYGKEKARIDGANYDESAAYSVTYLMLDKYPAVDFSGTYAENEKALLLDAVKSIQENTTRISVLESKKADKDSPAWITPTLLNGWVNFESGFSPAGYHKDSSGYVHIRGLIKSGYGGAFFMLPKGYRPAHALAMSTISAANAAGDGALPASINIFPDGTVITAVNFQSGFMSLEGITFLAEQ